MSGAIEFLPFDDRSSACTAAAELLAARIGQVLDSAPRAQASLVVSGGTTPGPCFDHLSGEALDWSRVTVVPSDERWVPATDPESNEGLIRKRLLRDRAGTGRVLSFFREGVDAAQAPVHIEADLQQVARPFSATLLGMGEDGHFASLFPDFTGLPEALDPGNSAACVMVRTAGSPHLRISLTLSALLHSAHTVLLIFGEAKKTVFDAARAGGSAYPVEALLRESGKPLTVIWAP